jgi:hypothetical protein
MAHRPELYGVEEGLHGGRLDHLLRAGEMRVDIGAHGFREVQGEEVIHHGVGGGEERHGRIVPKKAKEASSAF